MANTTTLLILLLGAVSLASGIKCIYGSNNGKEGWWPKKFQGDSDNKFCLNVTMPVDVGSSTLYLCDVFGMCKKDGCQTDPMGRRTCCCSVDLCNSARGFVQLLVVPLLIAVLPHILSA